MQKPVVMPQPKVAPAPKIASAPPPTTAPRAIEAQRPGTVPLPPMDIEAMKRDARQMLAVFSRNGASAEPSTATFPFIPGTDAMIDAAVREAMAAFR